MTKVATALVMPLGFVSACLLVLVARRLTGRRRGESILLGIAAGVIWLSSSPYVAMTLVERLERQFPPLAIDAAPSSDVAIVLGGVLEPASPPRVIPHLNGAADRLTYAARLYAAGRVREIVVSSGKFDWHADEPTESENMAEVLGWLGVPRSAVVLEGRSRNTGENARATSEIWHDRGYKTGLLVTSAVHMPRARLEFWRQGLDLVPAPADVWVSDHQRKDALNWLPSAVALGWTTAALKEYLGLAVLLATRWRGQSPDHVVGRSK